MLIAQILPKHCSKLQKPIEIMSEKPSWEMFFFWWPPMFNVDWLKVWINTINCLIFRRQQDSIPPKVLEVSEIVDAIVSANIIAATLQSFDKEHCLCHNCGVFWRNTLSIFSFWKKVWNNSQHQIHFSAAQLWNF